MEEAQARKLAENEALAREVNERVGEISASWFTEEEPLEFVCECSRDDCTARVHVRMAEYREIRADPARFVLVEGHVIPEIEKVVGHAGDGVVVEKTGPGRDVAVETDPT